MSHPVKFLFMIMLPLLFIHVGSGVGSGAAKEYPLSYPDTLLGKLGIHPKDIVKNQEKFKKDPVHTEWMDHVHAVCPNIDPDRKNAIIKIHTTLLYLKERIDRAYLGGRIDQREFNTQSASLMKWFQKMNQSVLDRKEYELLFGLSGPDEMPETENTPDDGLGFPVENPETTVQQVKETLDAKKIAGIRRFYREHSRELEDFKRLSKSNKVQDVDPAQIAGDMKRIKDELRTAYRQYCRKTLTNKEFKMIFGKAGDKSSAFSDH